MSFARDSGGKPAGNAPPGMRRKNGSETGRSKSLPITIPENVATFQYFLNGLNAAPFATMGRVSKPEQQGQQPLLRQHAPGDSCDSLVPGGGISLTAVELATNDLLATCKRSSGRQATTGNCKYTGTIHADASLPRPPPPLRQLQSLP